MLDIRNLSAGYAQFGVLSNVNFALAEGEFLGILGRNGVGKTTLLKSIIGVQLLTAGRIRFGGADVTHLQAFGRARAGIGYVPQGRQIFPHLTVAENLESGLSALTGRGTGAIRAGVPDHIYELFPKLKQIAGRKGGVLSGGEQQQLAIGRALAGQPKLLLLDEPTEGIQPNVVQQIEVALRRVRRELGVTVMIVEQYLDFAWSFADHYCVMQRGRIVRQGSTAGESAAEVAHLVNI